MSVRIDLPLFDGNALCAEVDPELMFPEQGGDTRAAVKICEQCEIRVACGQWALSNGEHGVWGGMSEFTRRKLRGRSRRSAA